LTPRGDSARTRHTPENQLIISNPASLGQVSL
jgi:hypothetical protein